MSSKNLNVVAVVEGKPNRDRLVRECRMPHLHASSEPRTWFNEALLWQEELSLAVAVDGSSTERR